MVEREADVGEIPAVLCQLCILICVVDQVLREIKKCLYFLRPKNKSNRVRTIDAFSSVHIQVFVLVFVLILVPVLLTVA